MNLFELFFKIGVKDEASEQVSKLSEELGGGLKAAAGVGVAAVAAAAAAITKLTKESLESYAEYEQLVGGVKTLFSDSADTVQAYADRAYITAGISANQYMSTVTSFSASLLQSLGGDTEAAAELADQALIDMSDNANKMGTDMSMIQNAYQGFAKANYTMLDNLKLGYGGTKSEMRRLIKDASELDNSVDANSMSFDNIVRAIHAVQTEMGITGATADEAMSTITGSINMAKAAWDNLLVSMARGDDDLDERLEAFEKSFVVAAENIVPRVKTILSTGIDIFGDVVPIIVEALPEIVEELAPVLAKGIAAIIKSAVENSPEIYNALMQSIGTLAMELVFGLLEFLPGVDMDPVRNFLYGSGDKGGSTDGSHRSGLARVPYDGYVAELHEGERVLTKTEARRYGVRGEGGVTVNVNIDGARYEDEETLADAVARRLQRLFEDENAIYG